MNEYYEILGLKNGASKEEIKKAYFKMVRKHTPESDPEMFQKIRRAYEQLKDMDEKAASGPEFAPLTDPEQIRYLDEVMTLYRKGSLEKACSICEEACAFAPDEVRFLYLLNDLQDKCGYTGKAVKSAEKLVQKDPENIWYQRRLAYACYERGYMKKAFPVFKKVYEMGARDLDFILMFADECDYYGDYIRERAILLEILEHKEKWKKDEFPDFVEIFFHLFSGADRFGTELEVLRLFSDFVDGHRSLFSENAALAVNLLDEHFFRDTRNEVKERMLHILDTFEAASRRKEVREDIHRYKEEYRYGQIQYDDRFLEIFKIACSVFCFYAFEDDVCRRYAETDVKLCMLMQRGEVLGQTKLLETEYPALYEKLRDFFEILEKSENPGYLKEKMKKDYDRMDAYMHSGYFYEWYPEEKSTGSVNVIVDGYSDMPFVRNGKKVGRNDPCPCGSGKKYKQCCMRKNAV
ncbi:MAG: DnaJ domain-containing protein [Lachnospiraceae bacterium]|nr:DnaJ domain-containing protein [Lachnospiraceae bacterium]